MLLQIRNKHITPPPQAFHLLTVVILALPFPLWDKRAVRCQAIIIEILDMGNQIALTVANIKPSVIMKILPADSNGNSKIRLMIPTYIFIALTLTVLLFVQNAEQIITEGKAQIGVAVIKLPVIKGRVFRKTDRKLDAVWLLFRRCFLFLLLGHNDL